LASPTGKRPAVERLHLEPTSFAPRISRQSPVLYWATAPVHTTSLTSSRGNAARPREAALHRRDSHSFGFSWHWQVHRHQGGDWSVHDLLPGGTPSHTGTGSSRSPEGVCAARCRTRAAPYTSPSSALIWSCSCSDLSSVVRCRVATRLRNRATCPAHHHAPRP
jgi:hypothetical protein